MLDKHGKMLGGANALDLYHNKFPVRFLFALVKN
jgi:hypothetical protein